MLTDLITVRTIIKVLVLGSFVRFINPITEELNYREASIFYIQIRITYNTAGHIIESDKLLNAYLLLIIFKTFFKSSLVSFKVIRFPYIVIVIFHTKVVENRLW